MPPPGFDHDMGRGQSDEDLAGGVTAAIVRHPCDGRRQPVHTTEAMLGGVVMRSRTSSANMPAMVAKKAHCLAIALHGFLDEHALLLAHLVLGRTIHAGRNQVACGTGQSQVAACCLPPPTKQLRQSAQATDAKTPCGLAKKKATAGH